MRDSNSRPLGPKPSALAIWANSRNFTSFRMVGVGGLEPPTSPLSEVRSNRLSYTPILYNYLQSGAKRQNRTADTRLFRPLLYHWATLAQKEQVSLYEFEHKMQEKNHFFKNIRQNKAKTQTKIYFFSLFFTYFIDRRWHNYINSEKIIQL